MHLLPGDPFMSQRLNPEIKANLYAKHGLDQPVARQYLDYLSALARFDLGESLKYPGRTVNEIIAESFPVSAAVGILALVLALVLGVTLGVLAGVWQSRWPDRLILAFSTLGLSIQFAQGGTGLSICLEAKNISGGHAGKPITLCCQCSPCSLAGCSNYQADPTEMIEVLKGLHYCSHGEGLDPARVICAMPAHALPPSFTTAVLWLQRC